MSQTTIRELLSYRALVDQCWGLLKQSLTATFPLTTRAHPSPLVFVQPGGYTWPGDFWEEIVVPTLAGLLEAPPSYQDGWWNPMARTLVAGRLRRTLTGTRWESLVDFG